MFVVFDQLIIIIIARICKLRLASFIFVLFPFNWKSPASSFTF